MGHRKLTGAEFSQLHTSGIGFPPAQAPESSGLHFWGTAVEESTGKSYDILRDHTGQQYLKDQETGDIEEYNPRPYKPSRLAELREKYGAYSAISLIDPDGVNLVVEMGQVINELLDEIERLKRE